MSVVLEFTIAPEAFRLGEVLSGSGMQFELERIVPTGGEVLPFVWVTGEGHDSFAEKIRSHGVVEELLVLDRLGDRGLYRIEWSESPTDLTEAIEAAGGSVVRAQGDDEWVFQVRFGDHDSLSGFHDDVRDRAIPIEIVRTFSLSAADDPVERFDLTPDQREALRLALRAGYFTTPRAVNLEELADEIDITRQAMSKRIRHGNEKILRGVLPAVGDDAGARE